MKTRTRLIATALLFSLATTSAYTTTPLEPLLRDRHCADAFARRRKDRRSSSRCVAVVAVFLYSSSVPINGVVRHKGLIELIDHDFPIRKTRYQL